MSTEKKTIVAIDVVSIPKGWDLESLLKVKEEHGIVLYDSHEGGKAPIVIKGDDGLEVEIVDVNTEEGRKRYEETIK